MAARRRFGGILTLLAAAAIAGCGGDDEAATTGQRATTGAAASDKTLADLVAIAPAQKPAVEPNYKISRSIRTIDEYMTRVLLRADAYWKQVFRRSGIARVPGVNYRWPPPGQSLQTRCNEATGDLTAAYCSTDDTIYVSQKFAYDFWRGYLGPNYTGVYPGDFGLAFIIAHEYAHNVQTELGIRSTGATVKIFELQADCLAGAWANSEYYAGLLEAGDYAEALVSANAVGDYNFTDPSHHGTPAERVAAWRLGYNSGSGRRCSDQYSP